MKQMNKKLMFSFLVAVTLSTQAIASTGQTYGCYLMDLTSGGRTLISMSNPVPKDLAMSQYGDGLRSESVNFYSVGDLKVDAQIHNNFGTQRLNVSITSRGKIVANAQGMAKDLNAPTLLNTVGATLYTKDLSVNLECELR